MIAGPLGKIIDYLIIGMASWQVGGVFAKNPKLTARLADRIGTRTVTELNATKLIRHGRRLIRHRVALDSDRGRQETFYDFYRGPARARSRRPKVLMVYHHGMGEFPHDITFQRTFLGVDANAGVDLIALKATYHQPVLVPSPNHEFLADAACWVEMMADSVALAAYLAARHRAEYDGLFLGGISLGGIVTLATLTYRDCFDLYQPMMAGPDLPGHLRQSLFIHFTSNATVASLEQDAALAELNFVPAVERNLGRVQILAAEHDPVFRVHLLRQLQRRLPALRLEILPFAHIPGCMAGEALQARLFQRWREWALEQGFDLAAAPPPETVGAVPAARLQSRGRWTEAPA